MTETAAVPLLELLCAAMGSRWKMNENEGWSEERLEQPETEGNDRNQVTQELQEVPAM